MRDRSAQSPMRSPRHWGRTAPRRRTSKATIGPNGCCSITSISSCTSSRRKRACSTGSSASGQRRADPDSGVAPPLIKDRFVAHSRVMRALVEQVRRFAAIESNVLITGETGAGKNAVARELHARGPRAKLPFVTIDCASLAGSLIDSELFGHERGAFTDAVSARAGRFELAGAGTVYLDAVTELAIEAQGKLLRIVEEKRVERLGGRAPVAVRARIVASAGARIEDAVLGGSFRGDLYHRLRVLPLVGPPLGGRPEDILPLAKYFLKRAATAARRAPPALTRDAAAALRDYAWPGNVRELGDRKSTRPNSSHANSPYLVVCLQ